MPGGICLGPQDRVQAVVGERGDDSVVEHTRGMDHGGQRVLVVDGREKAGERSGVGDVAGGQGDGGGAESGQFGGEFLRAGRFRTAPARQHQVPGAVRGDQMPGEYAAERSGAAGEEHGSVAVERLGNGEHDLADVPGLAEEAEGLRCPADVPGPHRKRTQRAALEQRDHLGQHPADPLGARLDDVECLVGDSGVGVCDRFGVADVRLAHFHEPPTTGEQPQRGVHEGPGEGVQHHVDAPSFGGGAELLLELQRARGGDVLVVQAEFPQGVPLAGTGRPEHLGAEVARQLRGRHAHTASRGVHEDRFAGLERGQVDETVVRGEEHDGHRGGLGERPAVGNPRDHAVIGDSSGAETAAQQAHHAVTGHDPGHAGAGLRYDTGTLDAHRGLPRIHVEGDQDVTEVEPRRTYGHADLAGFELITRFRVGQQPQPFERPLAHAVEPPCRAVHRRQQCAVLPGPYEAECVECSIAYGELRLAAVDGATYDTGTDVGPRRFVQVQQDETLRVLGLRRPHQTPHRGGGQVGSDTRVTARVDRATGDDDQPGRVQARFGQPFLQEPERPVRRVVRGCEYIFVVGRSLGVDQYDVRCGGSRVEGCAQRGHVGVRVAAVEARAGSFSCQCGPRPLASGRLRRVLVLGDLDPAELEQRVGGGTTPVVELLGGHLAQCQRLYLRNQLSGGIGQDE